MSKKSNSAAVLAALLAGAATGVILGLLYAPEEGKKTRKMAGLHSCNLRLTDFQAGFLVCNRKKCYFSDREHEK